MSSRALTLVGCIPVFALLGCGSSALKKPSRDGGGGLADTGETTQGSTGGQAGTSATTQGGTGGQAETRQTSTAGQAGTAATTQAGTGGQTGTSASKGSTAGQGGTTVTTGTGGQAGTSASKQGSSAGQGGTGGLVSTGAGGTGGTLPTSSRSSAPSECTGPINTVSALWGFACPINICDVEAMASNCAGLPTSVTRLSIWKYFPVSYELVEFNFSGTHGKGCLYARGNLTAASGWDDVPTYCNGTSRTIVAGTYDTSWVSQVTPRTCEANGSSRDAGPDAPSQDAEAGAPVVPPATCFNLFSSTCQPCCPDPAPDCTGKPNGYPGYACTSMPDRFCSCQCYGGKWECGC